MVVGTCAAEALCGEEKEIAYYSSGRPYLKDGAGISASRILAVMVAVAASFFL